MPKEKLFDGSESEEEEVSFKTENEYAKRYDNWREKEELHKLEQKYGNKPLTSDVSDSEDESDEEPEISEEVESQFLKTLSLLKNKDPRIYDPNYKFFNETTEKKDKEEDVKDENTQKKKEVKSLADAFADSDDEDDNDGQIFKVEKKAPVPEKKEEKVKQFLSGKAEHIDPAEEKDLAPLRALWSKPDLDEGEAFLRDYILNKKYLEPDEGMSAEQLRDDEALEADEKTVEQQGQFERAYNFRFEEPDHEFLKRYPRTMNSIRPKDDRRARKRAEIRERKEEEKKRKMEEIGRLKALKLKEIQQKLEKIKEVTGNEELAFKDSDIEGDFDPEEHDRRMRAIFDEQYYDEADDEKPQFPELDDELEIENWDDYDQEAEVVAQAQNGDEGPHCEDEEFNMDAEYDPKQSRATLLQEIQETLGKKRRNRKRKSKLAKLLQSEKPKFVPEVTDKTYDEYMEEYYKMDCEDVIAGDLPTRFKYRETVPNSFGLTVEEILLADDKELNRWASLKKTVKYRPENVEKSEVKTYQQKAEDLQLKRKMLPSLFKELPEEPEVVVPIEEIAKKKKKKKKNKSKQKENGVTEATDTSQVNESEVTEEIEDINSQEIKEKKRKRKRKDNSTEAEFNAPTEAIDQNEEVPENNATEGKKKKKRKHVETLLENETNEESKFKENYVTIAKHKDSTTDPEINVNDGPKLIDNETKVKSKKNKKKDQQHNNTEAEHVAPSQGGSTENRRSKKDNQKKNHSNPLKRKHDAGKNEEPVSKKNKFKNNFKGKGQNKNTGKNDSGDPLGNLSDERLKAYGLNPKKYRSFLKYKKF